MLTYYNLAHLFLSSFTKNQEEILHTTSFSIKKEAVVRLGPHYLPCSTMKALPVCPRQSGTFFPQQKLPRAKCVLLFSAWREKRLKVNH